jgi:hypothetical protein
MPQAARATGPADLSRSASSQSSVPIAGHTPLPWRAQIWRHSGHPDTVCIKAGGREIISWTGFDGVRCTKAEIRANARFVQRACNSHYQLLDDLGEAFSTLIYIFECSDDEQASRAAKEAADKIERTIAKARGQ